MHATLILLAAGSSNRMAGRDKLLEEVDGMPCVRTMALRGVDAGLPVIAALPASPEHPRALALAEVPALCLPVADAALGMAHSLRAAIRAVDITSAAALVLPADMPAVTTADLRAIVTSAEANPSTSIVQAACEDGRPGHPILFRRRLFAEFASLSGDTGARAIVEAHRADHVLYRLRGNRARLDLDTPKEWAAWRTGQAALTRDGKAD